MAILLMHCNQVKSVSELTAFIFTNTCIFSLSRLSCRDGANNILISALAKKHNVPRLHCGSESQAESLEKDINQAVKEKGMFSHLVSIIVYFCFGIG